MASLRSVTLGFACASIVLAVVGATMSDQILKVPLLEVGSIWVKAFQNFTTRIYEAIFQIPDPSSPFTYIGLAVGLVLLYYAYQFFMVPLNRVKLLGDLGYVPEGKLSQKEMVNVVRKRRMVGEVPPVYPNGWFAVFESHLLKSGEVHNVSYLGETLN